MAIATNIGTDPLYKKYGSPDVPAPLFFIYLPYMNNIPFTATWAGDTTTDPIANQRMEAKVYFGADNTLLGTIVKTSVLVGSTKTYNFDFSEMLKTVFESEIYINISSDQINTGQRKLVNTFYAVFTPIYIDIKGVERRDDSTTSNTYTIANTIFNYEDGNKKIIDLASDYHCINSTKKVLTSVPRIRKIKKGETDQVAFIRIADGNPTANVVLHFIRYDLGGNPTAGSKTAVNIHDSRYGIFTVSDANDNCLLFSFDSLSKVEVWLQIGSTIISEKITYIMDKNCGNDVRLWWRNVYGGMDKFTFTQSKKRSFMIEDKQTFINSSNQTKLISSEANEVIRAWSNIEVEDMNWLKDLMASTDVYYEFGKDNLIPIEILNTEEVISDDDGLLSVEIAFKPANKYITHNG